MRILGLMGQRDTLCHDGSAALFQDGQIVTAIEQERISRNKHAPGEAPIGAVKQCLNHAGIVMDDIDYFTYGWMIDGLNRQEEPGDHLTKSATYTEEILPPSEFEYDTPLPLYHVDHHITHLMASVTEARFDDAACLIADGRAESSAVLLAEYDGKSIEIVNRYPIVHSLGLFYEAAAHYAGLGRHGGGKLMGLSSYGTSHDRSWFTFDTDSGEFDCPIEADEDHDEVFHQWMEFFKRNCYPYRAGDRESIMYYQDFAATVQANLESLMLSLAEYLNEKTESDNLAIGGGVALNCVANRALYRSDLFEDLFSFPAANDAGCSVGSIYELCRALEIDIDPQLRHKYFTPFLGPEYPVDDIALPGNVNMEVYRDDVLISEVAADLERGGIVGWYQGRPEFGPRALGNRSILGSPANRKILYEINRLKGRAPWRPLAPSVLDDSFTDVFEGECSTTLARYMTTTAKVREEWHSRVPATIHFDRTSRPQYVTEEQNERYYRLIEQFHKRTGIPLLINTSFNMSGDPIVNKPAEAVETFQESERMDTLVLGNRYISM